MESIITMAATSSSSLFGNVGCAIKDLVLAKFPENYFKYTNVSTEMAFSNIRRHFGKNSFTEIKKRQFPYLIIQPTYQIPEQDGFMQGIPLTKNMDDLQFGITNGTLFKVLADSNNGYNLKYKMNRDKIEYEVRIVVQTLHQQLDLYKIMLNHMVWERSFYHTCALEAVIPKTIVSYMAKLSNIDLKDKSMIPQFLKHLNKNSMYPITYKMRNASATDEYFMYYLHNLVVTMYDLSIESGSKKNMVDDMYEITFKVSAEFNNPGLFIIGGEKNKARDIKIDLKVSNLINPENSDYIPLFTLTSLWNLFPQEKDNKTMYGTTIFHTVSNSDKEDTVDLSYILDEIPMRAIKIYSKYNAHNTLMKVYVLKNNMELIEGVDFILNTISMDIKIKNCDDSATYRMLVYVDNTRLNELVADIIEDERIKDKKNE